MRWANVTQKRRINLRFGNIHKVTRNPTSTKLASSINEVNDEKKDENIVCLLNCEKKRMFL